jgi:hypothetical protein
MSKHIGKIRRVIHSDVMIKIIIYLKSDGMIKDF